MSALQKLIPVINKLQDVLAVVGGSSSANVLDLPQITVVGSQSAGKSSVLENIVGHEILPRGSGIVTRRPLILQLYNTTGLTIPDEVKKEDGSPAEWGEFLHTGSKKFTSWTKIRDEITRATDAIAGDKCLSDDPIRLKIFSHTVVNLTLVDLPGICKVPVGDQPKDIEIQIRRMVHKYVSKPNAIILAVTAGNTDLATSDALQVAREVDPEFTRTVGVITKLDLMDRGTDAGEILRNRAHPLRLGWIGVVNRSQADIKSDKSIEKALQDEKSFFLKSPAYRDIAEKNGTQYLTRALNDILVTHIQHVLPDLRRRVQDQLTRATRELDALGSSDIPDDNRDAFMLQMLNQYSADYCATIEGRSQGAAKSELHGGARISYVFTDVLSKMISSVNARNVLNAEEIRTLIRNASGPTPTLFLPDFAFQLLANRMIMELETPCMRVTDLVLEELTRIARHVPSPTLRRFAALRSAIVSSTCDLLRTLYGPCKTHILDTIKCELAYTNTRHPHFVGGAGALNLVETQKAVLRGEGESNVDGTPGEPGGVPQHLKASSEYSETDRLAIEVLPKLLESYYQIIRVKIQDTVPKAIMHFLVARSKEAVQNELVTQLYKPTKIDELLIEDPTVVEKRKNLRQLIMTLTSASDHLDEVRDVAPSTTVRGYRPSGPTGPKREARPTQQHAPVHHAPAQRQPAPQRQAPPAQAPPASTPKARVEAPKPSSSSLFFGAVNK